ncbi:hypothetical protein LTT66_01830 [Nocardia gipuzkoensis]|uniref:hypothetical protein n=1 Tax=Nocardia gipuzkoensis TaxID=2749991 RepID=UPI001E35F820|nr:hypothetical protein [Nocardia gipuzkoensis]UGT68988.1 hypothetical protein LTT66_01830 [Nocardia gipuzkoensis]
MTAFITDDSHIRSRALGEAQPTLTIAEDRGVRGATGCDHMEHADRTSKFRIR